MRRLLRRIFKKKMILKMQIPADVKIKNTHYKTIQEKLGTVLASKFNKIVNKHLREMEKHFKTKDTGWDLDFELLRSEILHDFMGNFCDFILIKIALKGKKIKFVKPKFNRIMISNEK